MSYGQDSSDADYIDNIPDDNSQASGQSGQAQTFDPSQFVSREAYSALEQKFAQAQPQLQTIDKLARVFNPQQPQFSPEQLEELNRVRQITQAIVNPEFEKFKQTQEQFVNQAIDSTAQQMGFADRYEQESWYFEARRSLLNKANQGDQQAGQIVSVLENLYKNEKYLEMQQFVSRNFDYLDQHAGRMKIGRVATQQIGHGFNNSPFSASTELTPEAFEQKTTELASKGDWSGLQALQSKFANQIKSKY